MFDIFAVRSDWGGALVPGAGGRVSRSRTWIGFDQKANPVEDFGPNWISLKTQFAGE
jgi:hypothetical protein